MEDPNKFATEQQVADRAQIVEPEGGIAGEQPWENIKESQPRPGTLLWVKIKGIQDPVQGTTNPLGGWIDTQGQALKKDGKNLKNEDVEGWKVCHKPPAK